MSAIENDRGVGQCPERPEGFGHLWAGVLASGDARNPCRFCGRPGRDNVLEGESGGYFGEATAARSAMLVGVRLPMQSGTGKVREDLTPAQLAKAAEIVADKKRRDAEAVASGTARPGQIAGAPKGSKS
jgi:hypothetical protein